MVLRYFLSFCGLSFHFLDSVLRHSKVFNFDKARCIYFYLIACAFGVKSKKILLSPKIQRFTLCSSIFRPFSHFELIFFISCVIDSLTSLFTCGYPVIYTHLLKILFSQWCSNLVEIQLTIDA